MDIKEREMLLSKCRISLEVAEAEHAEEMPELEEIVKALIKTIPVEALDHHCPYCGRAFSIKTNLCSSCGQAMR